MNVNSFETLQFKKLCSRKLLSKLIVQFITVFGYPFFSFQEEDPRTKYLTQAAMHMACARTNTLMTGCKIVHMALPTIWSPMVPPGKKLTKYHSSATSWMTFVENRMEKKKNNDHCKIFRTQQYP